MTVFVSAVKCGFDVCANPLLSLRKPKHRAGQVHEREIVSGRLIVSRGNATASLQPVEEDLHEVTASVKSPVISAAATACGVGRDHGLHPARSDRSNDSVGVIAGISDAQRPNRVFEQRLGESCFVPLSCGQCDEERPATRIDDGMKLGREATSRVPQRIGAGPPFAPLAS
jgi:hypothetical protein